MSHRRLRPAPTRTASRIRARRRSLPRCVLPQIAHIVLRSVADTPLTEREVQILRLIAEGTNNLDIADRLGLSLGTVKGHVRDILDKLQASDRTHAAVIGLKRRLI